MASSKKNKPSSESKGAQRSSEELARVRELVEILEASTLTELEFEDSDIVVKLSRKQQQVTVAAPVAAAPVAAAPIAAAVAPAAAPASAAPAAVDDGSHEIVKSPFVGTFYRAASPTSKPFTEVGATVKAKQTLCIVEAMKLMNEIECEVEGVVAEILVENGEPVQFGDPLFKIAVK